MRITNLRTDKVFVPFQTPHLWASGRRPGTTRLIARLATDAGLVGYGETNCLWPFVEPVLHESIKPFVIGEDPHNVERVYRKVEANGYYHHKRAMVAALAAVEMAMWDLIGKAAGQPLYQLWGGAFRTRVEAIAYLHVKAPEEMAREAQVFVAQGFRTIKLKIGMDPESDIEIVRAVRAAVGPRIELRADVNGSWTPGTAKRQLAKLEPFDLQYVEQPLVHDDLTGHRELRRCSRVPIALDESAFTLTDVINIVRAEAADVILLDPHEAGGCWVVRKAAAIAEAAGLPVTLHSGAELAFSTAAYIHLAAATPNCSLAIDSSYYEIADDLSAGRHEYVEGAFTLPEKPGLGVELDEAKLDRYRTDEIRDPYLDRERPDWFTQKPMY